MSNNLYMPLHPGDYLADAAHLTTIEHGAYFLLILNYWQRGEALAADDRKLARICRLTDAEWAEVKPSLAEFFVEEDGLWKHKRIEAELVKATEKSAKARQSANNRYATVKQSHCERTANALPSQTERTANQDQVQDQEERKDFSAPARSKKGTRLPEDWQPSPDLIETATKLGLSAAQFDREVEKFRDYWHAKPGAGGVKLDWDGTARNWMRTAAERISPPPKTSIAAPQTPATGVWIKRGSPQWQAWTKHKGKEPFFTAHAGNEGAFFRTEWPPPEGVAA